MPPTVLLADDDRAMRKLMRAYLSEVGIAVHEAADGEEAVQLARRLTPDLIVLDVLMAGGDGFDVLRRLGSEGAPPVVMLTAVADEVDQLVGYRLGVLDYMVKPVSPKIVAAKVKAVLARMRAVAPPAAVEVGPIRIDVPGRMVTCGGEPVDLTRRELDLLVALAEHPGWVYTRDQLLSTVWGYDAVGETRLVDMQVANLRRKLGDAGALVETVRGVGYRLRPPGA
jgi:two-component system OmpR family response regulator